MPDSDGVRLAPLTSADEPLVDGPFDRLTAYSMLVDGLSKIEDNARRFLTDLPPGTAPPQKHVFAVTKNGSAVGLVDVIDGYPDSGTAFLGLLAIAEDRHGDGIGSAAARLTEAFARNLGSAKLRLAVIEQNPALGFWRKMGFVETGERNPHSGAARTNMALLMEKPLA